MSVPSWLIEPGLILIKRYTRTSKYEPLVEKADLIHATPSYAHVRFLNGHKTKVSLRDVAPFSGDEVIDEVDDECESESFEVNEHALRHFLNSENSKKDDYQLENNPSGQSPPERSVETTEQVSLRLFTLARKTPDRLMYQKVNCSLFTLLWFCL